MQEIWRRGKFFFAIFDIYLLSWRNFILVIFQIYTTEAGFVCCLSRSSVNVDMYVVVDVLFSKHIFWKLHPHPYPTSKSGRYFIYIFCLREHDVTTVSSLQILRNFNKFPAINIAPFIIILHFKWGGFQRKNYFTWEEVSPRGYRSRQRKGHHFCTGLVRTFVKDLLHTQGHQLFSHFPSFRGLPLVNWDIMFNFVLSFSVGGTLKYLQLPK